MITKLFSLSVVFVCFGCLSQALAFREPDEPELPDFDSRLGAQPPALDIQRQAAAEQLKARIPGVRIDLDAVLAAPKWILNTEGYLSRPGFLDALSPPALPGQNPSPLLTAQDAQADPHRALKRFLDENVNLFGHGSEVLQPARITREFVDASTGMRTVVWEQQLDGIAVFEAVLIGHITRFGELACVTSQFVPRVDEAAKMDAVTRSRMENNPPTSAEEAIVVAADAVGEHLEVEMVTALDPIPSGAERKQRFAAEPVLSEARVELVWLPSDRSNIRLCWRVILTSRGRGETFQVIVDVQAGVALIRQCLTLYLSNASYRVFTSDSPSPFSPGWSTPNTNQPPLTNRVLVTLSALSTNASPNGWINDGTNKTVGNNVDARLDWNGSDPPLGYGNGQNTAGSSFRVFDYNLALTNDPTAGSNPAAAVVQLFYWCNWMHDRLYALGFTEAAGNYQYTNFGRGGMEGDPILADAQYSRFGNPTNYNNAVFAPAGDGTPGWIAMFLWNGPNPDRDADLDAEIILHECTHGLSTRRVGGGGGLRNSGQAGGLGEGWSDFYGMSLLSEPGDDIDASYPFGGYATYQLQYGPTNTPQYLAENYYYGIRRYPYSTDLNKNPLTFKDIDPGQALAHTNAPLSPRFSPFNNADAAEVHRAGEVWCVTLWGARANLIDQMGWTNGNPFILKLTTDGMNLSPPNPTFLQARDGVLVADRVNTGGTNLAVLWQAFARRGMGYGATSPYSDRTDGVVEAYDLPPQFTNLWAWSFQTSGSITSSPAIGGDGTIYVGSSGGKLYAINPNGTLKWQFAPGGSGAVFSSSPAIGKDETIYIGCGNSNLYAINPNGTGKWTNNLGGSVFSSPAIANDGTIYVGTLNKKVYALNTNGTVKTGWPYSASGSIYSSPAIASNGTVYVGGMDGYLYALNSNGSSAWGTYLGGAVFSSPAIGKYDTIFVGCDNGKIYGVNPDGTLKWTNNTGAIVRSSPTTERAGAVVYVGNDSGNLYSLFQGSGSTQWVFSASGRIQSAPLRTYDLSTYVGSSNGTFYILHNDASNLWSQTLQTNLGAIVSSPVLGENGMLYFGSVNSNIYALHVPTVLSRYAWPTFRGNLRHTGNAASLIVRPIFSTVSNMVFQISGPFGLTNVVESSTDVANWAAIGTNILSTFDGTVNFTNACSNCFYRVKSLDGTIVSLNALGHMNVSAPAGYSMIANQLNHPAGNAVANLLPNVPDGCIIWKWNEATQSYYDANEYVQGYGWYPSPNMTLNPGEGVIFQNVTSSALTLTFYGELPQGYLLQSVPSTLSIRSSILPQAGRLDTTLAFPVLNGDVISRMTGTNQTYTTYSYTNNQWATPPGAPIPNIGESFWINTSTGRNWGRTFSVWP